MMTNTRRNRIHLDSVSSKESCLNAPLDNYVIEHPSDRQTNYVICDLPEMVLLTCDSLAFEDIEKPRLTITH